MKNYKNIKKSKKPKTEKIKSDTLGSYTGNPDDGSYPVQDADDL